MKLSLKDVADRLRLVGKLEPDRLMALTVLSLLRGMASGSSAVLLSGPPGSGKTALALATSAAFEMSLVFYQAHSWSDSDELFVGVDVVSAVAGDASSVRQDGVLAKAARLSETGRVCLVIDEIEKAPDRVENLFLDYLQNGRVPVQPGKHLQTKMENVVVFFTTNETRPLGDAFLRRVRRTRMAPLPVEKQEQVLMARSGLPLGVVRIAWKLARDIAAREGNQYLSLQEGQNLLREIRLAETPDDLKMSLAGWSARTHAGESVALGANVSALWAEIVKARG